MGGSQSSSRLCKSLTTFPFISIFKAIKGLFRKLRFIIAIFSRPTKSNSPDPILPVKKPCSSHHPSSLVKQPFLVSPPRNEYSPADDIQQVDHRIIYKPDPILPVKKPCSSHHPSSLVKQPFLVSPPRNEYSPADDILQVDHRIINKPDPILPVKKPCSSHHPSSLVQQPFLVSPPRNEYSIQQVDHRIISIPDPTCSSSTSGSGSGREEIVTCLSAVFIQENVVEENKLEIYKKNKKEKRINNNVVKLKGGIRWIKHYGSCHRILLVGEGDFSFSLCLAVVFGAASNLISTSLDSQEFLNKNYQFAPFNIIELKSRECKVMHGIDSTKMAKHPLLGHLKFDRIIFNFPYAGFFKNLSRESQLRRHRRLVSQFLKNAKEMLSENGEIHITHKTNGFHSEWNLEFLASSHRLRLIEAVKFNHLDYPGYSTKYGFGGDNYFNCNPSKTYKFGLETDCY